jgi:hypothetical protein
MDQRNAIKEAVLFSGIVLGLSYLVFWGPIAVLQLPTASFVGGAKGSTWALILFILGGFVPSAVGLALARTRDGPAGFVPCCGAGCSSTWAGAGTWQPWG